jgi:hypothetical protein
LKNEKVHNINNHCENSHDNADKTCVDVTTETRLWVDTKAARKRDSYSPSMCDAKLAESAEAQKR